MSQQLVKKDSDGRYSNVMPKSWIEAIKDKNTGQTLVEILQGFNMYFLSYNGNTSATRCLVPTTLRKKGLWITYVKYDGNVYTEWYAANDIDDKSWGDSSNWRIGNNTLVGDITISANGNWVINGIETEFKAVGEKGNTPLIRVANNKLQVSYNLGETYLDVTDNPVYTKFRWSATSGDIQANNVGRIQASTDEGKTWVNMSNDFINNLHISKYIGANEPLPTSGIAEGTIYAKGPTYAVEDTSNSNPIYRLWVYAWKNNILAWQDNGEFTSIAAGIVQELGDNENAVMSQKTTTKAIHEILYDVSARNGGAVFESLQALLSSSNLSTLIPTSVRHGGMSIRFIQSSDNKYVQYRLMSDTFNTTPANWQGVDTEITANSKNIAESGNVYSHLSICKKEDATIGNSYIASNGIIKTSDSWTSYTFELAVSSVSIMVKNVVTNDVNLLLVAFYSDTPSQSTFISGVPFGSSAVSSLTTTIPENCKYVVVTDRRTTTNDIFIFISSENLYPFNKEISDLQDNTHSLQVIEKSHSDALTIIKGLSSYQKLATGYKIAKTTTGYNIVSSSQNDTWLIETKNLIISLSNIALGRQDVYEKNIAFLSGNAITVENLISVPNYEDYSNPILVPSNCLYIAITNRRAVQPSPTCNFVQFANIKQELNAIYPTLQSHTEQIGNIKERLNLIKTLSNALATYQPGYFIEFDAQGSITSFSMSEAWVSWLMPANNVDIIASALLGKSGSRHANIIFLSSDIITQNNIVGFVDNVAYGAVNYANVVIPNGCTHILLTNRTANCANPSANIRYNSSLEELDLLISSLDIRTKNVETALSLKKYGSIGSNYIVGQTSLDTQTIRVGSDFTFMNVGGVDYMLTFFAYDGGNAVELSIRAFGNGYNQTPTYNKTYSHKFTHCNTVDYNRDNDCLIFGDGGGTDIGTGKFYVIPNASSIFLNAEDNHEFTFDNTTHIEYDCDSSFGGKLQAVWGEKNGYTHDIIYVITNNNQDVRRILLGRGSNELENGVYNSQAGANEFNGTYKVLTSYHQDSISMVNQGTQFYKGMIICGVGYAPAGISVLCMKLNNTNNSIDCEYYSQQIYDGTGSALSRSTNGICFDSQGNLVLGLLLLYQGASNRGIVFTRHIFGN